MSSSGDDWVIVRYAYLSLCDRKKKKAILQAPENVDATQLNLACMLVAHRPRQMFSNVAGVKSELGFSHG